MTDANCGNCRYWHRQANGNGVCRRRPPTAVLIGMQAGPLGQPQPAVNGFFPPTGETIWCGEHAWKLAAVDLSSLSETAGQA